MTDEQFERRMEFLLQQQAQFSADMQRLQEAHLRLQESQQRLQEAQAKTDERIGALVDVSLSLAHHQEEIDRRLAAFISETNQRFQELAESQTHTDRRLDALIDIMRRQLEGGNGREPRA